MKQILLILAIIISSTIFAQEPIKRSIGEFTKLKVYDLIQVELIKSKNNKIVISGNNSNQVIVNNKNGKLKIKMNLERIFDGKKTKIKLYYTSIDVIDVNEGAKVHSKDVIEQSQVDLRSQEGGKIDVKLNTSSTNIKAVTGGIIKTSGKSKTQYISLLTGGVYKGSELKTDKTELVIRATGQAHVNASELVDIKIRAGGDVFIYGNPKTVNKSRVFGGRIKRMEE